MKTEDLNTDTAGESAQPLNQNWPAGAALFYIGLATTNVSVELRVFGSSLAYLLALLLGVIGIRHILSSKGNPRAYFPAAFALATWVFISAMAAWLTPPLFAATAYASWLLVIIPGMAWWLRSPRLAGALLAGIGVTAVYYAFQVIRGLPGAEEGAEDPSTLVAGNRNAIAMVLVFVVPFLLVGRSWIWLRGAGVVAALGSIAALGSRASLLGALVAAAVVLLLERSHQTRAVRATSVIAGGAVVLILAPSLLGAAGFTLDRIGGSDDGKVTTADELRTLLLDKAFDLTRRYPAFGVGRGRFTETYSPVAQEAEHPINRRRVNEFQAHNTFAQVMAEFGIPGAALYILYLTTTVVIGLRARASARGPTAAIIGLVAWASFHSAVGGTLIFLTIAMILGTARHGINGGPVPTKPLPRANQPE